MCDCMAAWVKVGLGLLLPRLNTGSVCDKSAAEGSLHANAALYKFALPLPLLLCQISGWLVTTLWVNCPLYVSQVDQLSLPSFCRPVNEWRSLKRLRIARVFVFGLGVWPRLNASPMCDAQCHWGGMCGLWRSVSADSLWWTHVNVLSQ